MKELEFTTKFINAVKGSWMHSLWLSFSNQSQSECTLSHLLEHLSIIGTKSQCLRFGNLSPSHSKNVEFEPLPLAFITSGGEMKRLSESC